MALALPLFAAVLLAFAAPGALAQSAPPRTIEDIKALVSGTQPDEEQRQRHLARLAEPVPPKAGAAELARFHHQRSRSARAVGDAERRLRELELALPHAIAAKLPGNAEIGEETWVRFELANAHRQGGDPFKAIAMVEELARAVGRDSGWHVAINNELAWANGNIGRFEEAQRSAARAEDYYLRMRGFMNSLTWPLYSPSWLAGVEDAKGYVFRMQGRLAQAEQSYRLALAAARNAVAAREQRISRGLYDGGADGPLGHIDNLRVSLSRTLQQAGRLDEAEVLARESLTSALGRLGRGSWVAGNAALVLSGILYEKGRYRDALELSAMTIRMYAEAGLAPTASFMVFARRTYASFLTGNGRHAEAAQEFERLRTDLATSPPMQEALGSRSFAWAISLSRTGRAAEAIAMFNAMIERETKILGARHGNIGLLCGFLAIAQTEIGDLDAALREFRESISILLGAGSSYSDYAAGSPAGARRVSLIVQGYVRLLALIHASGGRPGLDAMGEAFRMADAARDQSVQRALAASAVRTLASNTNDPGMTELIRKQQDAKNEREALYRFLIEQVSAPAERQLPQVQADMRKRIDAIEGEATALEREIVRRFPKYAELVAPRTLSIDEARAALRPGEVLLSLLSTPEATYVWAVPQSGAAAFATASLNDARARELVTRLRRAVDVGNATIDQVPSFDVAAAHELYAALIRPVEGALAGHRTLLVVANGALAQLPLSVLVTESAPLSAAGVRFAEYANVAWLAKRYAVSQLPSVASIATLRGLPQGNSARAPFVGFGDPQFGPVQVALSAATRGQMRNLMIARAAPERADESPQSAPAPGKPLDWVPYAQLAPLPDTRDELIAIATALSADPKKDLYLGADATKERLFSVDLLRRRIVAFATHGLIPGDFPGLTQPALALAAPADGKGDGLLTLEEVLSLKLDADWVVLSACNTAAGDGAGAEAVSGLGRAFFYAGTRALLVTHWPVETVSAKLLVAGIFERYARDAKLSRAEALRQSMLALINEGEIDPATRQLRYSYAHPLFWAPYATVGDGGR